MKCRICDNEAKGRSLYCSSACRYKYRDIKMRDIKNKRRRELRLSRKKERICYFCGKPFMPSTHFKKFCSVSCFKNNRKEREIERLNNLSEEEALDRRKKLIEYQKKYDASLKGKIKSLRGHEKRRDKEWTRAGIKNESLKEEILIAVDARDVRCVYCGREFGEGNSKKTRDHFNHELPFSEDNCVNACMSCNSSKGCIPVEKIPYWLERKHFKPSKFVEDKLK